MDESVTDLKLLSLAIDVSYDGKRRNNTSRQSIVVDLTPSESLSEAIDASHDVKRLLY